MGVAFENTAIVSGKWNVSRIIPRLYRWVYKVLRLSQLIVELWVPNQGFSQSAGSQSVVVIVGSQLGGTQCESYEQLLFDSHFLKFLFRINGGIKFWDLSRRLRYWRPEFDCREDGMFICLSILILWVLCENRWWGGIKHYFFNFCFAGVLSLSWCFKWVLEWDRKSYLGSAEIEFVYCFG